MSDFINLLLKGLVKTIIVLTSLLPFIAILFSFFATVLVLFPTFARSYMTLGLGAFILKFIAGWLSE